MRPRRTACVPVTAGESSAASVNSVVRGAALESNASRRRTKESSPRRDSVPRAFPAHGRTTAAAGLLARTALAVSHAFPRTFSVAYVRASPATVAGTAAGELRSLLALSGTACCHLSTGRLCDNAAHSRLGLRKGPRSDSLPRSPGRSRSALVRNRMPPRRAGGRSAILVARLDTRQLFAARLRASRR